MNLIEFLIVLLILFLSTPLSLLITAMAIEVSDNLMSWTWQKMWIEIVVCSYIATIYTTKAYWWCLSVAKPQKCCLPAK